MTNTEGILADAKRQFGLASYLRDAGYLLPNGDLLDFKRQNTDEYLQELCGNLDCDDLCSGTVGAKYDQCCDAAREECYDNEGYIEHYNISRVNGVDGIDDFLRKTCSARLVTEQYKGGHGGALTVDMAKGCEPTQAQLNALRDSESEGFNEVFFDIYDRDSPSGSYVSVRAPARLSALAIRRAYDAAYKAEHGGV